MIKYRTAVPFMYTLITAISAALPGFILVAASFGVITSSGIEALLYGVFFGIVMAFAVLLSLSNFILRINVYLFPSILHGKRLSWMPFVLISQVASVTLVVKTMRAAATLFETDIPLVFVIIGLLAAFGVPVMNVVIATAVSIFIHPD